MFKLLKKSKISSARLGIIKTARGDLDTPCFLPDATKGAIKHLSGSELENLGARCFVANTLHLFLRPGLKIIKKAGGLHNLIGWRGPILTDSGGYQVFSLIHKSKNGRVADAGAEFSSPLDGSGLKLTPERCIKIQFALGVDLMVCFDDCPPNDYNDIKLLESVERTINWAKRCKREYEKNYKLQITNYKKYKRPLLLAVIQGGNNLELRRHCARELLKIGFDGFGFGARHVDSAGNLLSRTLKFTAEQIPENKLRFGLGIGTPDDIVSAVKLGWDMFDCVIPTREGRHGKLFLQKSNFQFSIRPLADNFQKKFKPFYQTINITNSKFARDFSPINALSKLNDLKKYSKAYLHYLFKINDPLAARLASLNNLEFYFKMLSDARQLINNNKF